MICTMYEEEEEGEVVDITAIVTTVTTTMTMTTTTNSKLEVILPLDNCINSPTTAHITQMHTHIQ